MLLHDFCFMFWLCDLEACRILAPQPGIKSAPSCIRKQSLNHWTTREVPVIYLFMPISLVSERDWVVSGSYAQLHSPSYPQARSGSLQLLVQQAPVRGKLGPGPHSPLLPHLGTTVRVLHHLLSWFISLFC